MSCSLLNSSIYFPFSAPRIWNRQLIVQNLYLGNLPVWFLMEIASFGIRALWTSAAVATSLSAHDLRERSRGALCSSCLSTWSAEFSALVIPLIKTSRRKCASSNRRAISSGVQNLVSLNATITISGFLYCIKSDMPTGRNFSTRPGPARSGLATLVGRCLFWPVLACKNFLCKN